MDEVVQNVGAIAANPTINAGLASLDGFSSMLAGFAGGNIPIIIAIAVGLVFFAFFSYKIYTAAIIIIGAAAGGVPAYMYLSPLMVEAFDVQEAWFPVVVGAIGALLGIAIMKALQKLAVFIAGAALGYFLGDMINAVVVASGENEFLMEMPGAILIPIIAALILGILSGKMFKPIFVIGTALVSCISAANLIFSSCFGGVTPVALGIGVLVAVAAAIFQFKGKSKK